MVYIYIKEKKIGIKVFKRVAPPGQNLNYIFNLYFKVDYLLLECNEKLI